MHVALETTAALTAAAAAFLFLGRYWRTGFLDELILSAGLSLLALSNFAFATLPAVFNLQSNPASVWSMLFTGALAALLICVAALLPRPRVVHGRRWLFGVFCSTLVLASAGTVPVVVDPGLLPHGVTAPSSRGRRLRP